MARTRSLACSPIRRALTGCSSIHNVAAASAGTSPAAPRDSSNVSIVDGTLTASGCTLETYVFDVKTLDNQEVGWYPRTQADATALSSFLLPDILTYDSSAADGFPNGRRLRDGVIDVELNLLTNGRVTSMNVFDDNGTRITDGTNGTTAAFPYFGAPNDPPQGIINP